MLKNFHLNEVKHQYTEETVFEVQVGRGSKGAYKPRSKWVGNLSAAILTYQGINIGNGYKKRLLMDGKQLAKAAS